MLSTCLRSLSLFVVAISSLHAASFELPPLNSPPSNEHHVGKVVWADLVTPNLSNAEKFYGGLFGWTFRNIHAGDSDYVAAVEGGRPIAGIVEKPISVATRRDFVLRPVAARCHRFRNEPAAASRAIVSRRFSLRFSDGFAHEQRSEYCEFRP